MQPVLGTSEAFLSQFYCLCNSLDDECCDKEATGDLARTQELIMTHDCSDGLHVGGVWGTESSLSVREKTGGW